MKKKVSIIIARTTFTESKALFNQLVRAVESSTSNSLKRNSDCYEFSTDLFSLRAVPLTNKIRGFRPDILIVDDSIFGTDHLNTLVRPLISTGCLVIRVSAFMTFINGKIENI